MWHRFPIHHSKFANLSKDQWHLVVNIGGGHHFLFYYIPESLFQVSVEYALISDGNERGQFVMNFLSEWPHVGNDVPLDKVHHISCLTAMVPDDCDERVMTNNRTGTISIPREWFLYRYPCFCKTGKKCGSNVVFRQKQYQAVASESLVAFLPFDNYFRADEMTKGQTPDYDPEQPNQSNFNIMNLPLMQYQYNWFCVDRICGVQFVRKNQLKNSEEEDDNFQVLLSVMFQSTQLPVPKSLFSYSMVQARHLFTLSFFVNLKSGSFENADVLGLTRSEVDEPWDYYYFRISSKYLNFHLMNGENQIHYQPFAKCLQNNWCGMVVTFDNLEISIFEIGYGKLSTFVSPGLIEFDTIHIHRLSDEKGNLISNQNHPGIALGCLSIFNTRLNEDEINQLQTACESRGEFSQTTSTISSTLEISPTNTTRQWLFTEETTAPTTWPTLSSLNILPTTMAPRWVTTMAKENGLISWISIAVIVFILVILCCTCICFATGRKVC